MLWKYYACLGLLAINTVANANALDIIAGKSGEEQVKEAIDRAEKESSQAAKENVKTVAKAKVATQRDAKPTTADLKETLDKKVEELARLHEKHGGLLKSETPQSPVTTDSVLVKLTKSNEVSKFTKTDQELAKLASVGDIKDLNSKLTSSHNDVSFKNDNLLAKENAALEDESDKKMVDMAKKLNNLVLKFQNKMGRLSSMKTGHKNLAALLTSHPVDTSETTVKSVREKPHTPIDLNALRNALGLKHYKADPTKDEPSGTKTSYKEDTKLEDRLAMEAEEEKKFSNGDNYDENGENGGEGKESKEATSSLSPKEQASQEMQSYNALISSESNRELTQIQEEITKATQSSMGQVSVVGQKENVNTEAPSFPSLGGGLGGGLGGLGALGGMGALQGSNAPINIGRDSGATATGGGAPGEQFNSLQGAASEGLEGLGGLGGESSDQPRMPGAGQQVSVDGGQQPIDIGGSQEPVEMGAMGANSNPFAGGNQQMGGMEMNSMQQPQQQQQFMGGQQQDAPLNLQGGEQNMSYKKSKITHRKKEKSKSRKSRHKTLNKKT